MKAKYELNLIDLNFVLLKKSYLRPQKSVSSMRLLFRLLFGTDSDSKLSQNIREIMTKLFVYVSIEVKFKLL